MADTMLQALVQHLHRQQFKSTEQQSVYVTLILKSGTVVSGAVVSPQQFAAMNSEDNGGTCPRDFSFDEPSPASYVHLANTHILSNGTWVPIGTLRVPIDDVTCCGDKSKPAPPQSPS